MHPHRKRPEAALAALVAADPGRGQAATAEEAMDEAAMAAADTGT